VNQENKTLFTYFIKNLYTECCRHLVRLILTQEKYEIIEFKTFKISFYKDNFNEKEFVALLEKYGLGIIKNKELLIVEQIKQAVIELIYYSNNVDSIVRKSDYLVERLNMDYQKISRLFSKYEGITLEKYILLNKIERVKELILQNEYTLSEIAYIMDFSTVQHLSATFKKICGVKISEYKKNPEKFKKFINNLRPL